MTAGSDVDIHAWHAEMRAMAARICGEAGDPHAVDRLRLDVSDRRLVFSVIDAAACGASISGFLSPVRPDRAERAIRQSLNRILRQRARDAAILAAGDGPDPAWSIDMHVVAFAVLRNAGVNPALVALHDAGETERGPLHTAAERTDVRIGKVELRAGRASVVTISGRDTHPTEDKVFFYEGTMGGEMHVGVRGVEMPVGMMPGLSGRRLGEIITHPLLDGCETAVVVSAEANGDILTLRMADQRRTLCPPPMPADWLEFEWTVPIME